ncbi:acyltransferase [Pelagicoccus enzymogenes]|uniref:acyltransferase n=1 Tax=Pelagicoccus enzymogenes TaxID=2773457 RepID=UPI00280D1F56|nr:acyltransferase [Pelagicoccus enzymogenes]MDQ8201100.1 acyltransferase [Pelagicoccus enzymogenes]
MGKKVAIESPCRIMGANHISIKRDSFIGSDSWIAALPHLNNTESSKNAELIAIGENVCISGHCTITAVNSVKIEDHVLIARYVYISDHSHEYRDTVVPIKNQGIKNIKAVHIKKGAWIGQGAVICPGVTIGANSVVGANSIVRIDVPDHSVAAGNPASIIKKRKKEQ